MIASTNPHPLFINLVSHLGKTLTLGDVPPATTIAELKRKIHIKTFESSHLPTLTPEHKHLYLDHHDADDRIPGLDDDRTLADYNIPIETTLYYAWKVSMQGGVTSEEKEHNHHAFELQQLLQAWEHARPRCSATKFSETCIQIHFVRHGEGHHNVLAQTKGGCSCAAAALYPYLNAVCPYKEKQIMDGTL